MEPFTSNGVLMSTSRFAPILVLTFAMASCNANHQIVRPGDEADGGDSTTIITTCVGLGASCSGGRVCCGGICSVDGVCTQVIDCRAAGESCNDNLDCCLNRCEGDVCSGQRCLDTGIACTSDTSCCTAICTGGFCAPLIDAGTCRVVGQRCDDDQQCCSTSCLGGFCTAQAECRATDDLCFGDLDCCTNLCSKNDGSPGACVLPPGGCNQGGMPCASNSNCCTRICADPGTGATVCLAASGCRMTGLSCLDAQSCCGGGTNPNGSVLCARESVDNTFGRCDNGTACNPVGNICGASFPMPDGSTFTVSASQNCCDGKKEVCRLDIAGIPRCYGGGSVDCPTGYTGEAPCCIPAGDICQFRDQCCDNTLCVPDDAGVLRCHGSTCVPLGAVCEPGGVECCVGECRSNDIEYICQVSDNDCTPNGQICATAADCCSEMCVDNTCDVVSCQADGDVCTSDGDCCSSLSCIMPSGSLSGICAQGSDDCAITGQACSTVNPCCSGSYCVNTGSFNLCDGTVSCSCWAEGPA